MLNAIVTTLMQWVIFPCMSRFYLVLMRDDGRVMTMEMQLSVSLPTVIGCMMVVSHTLNMFVTPGFKDIVC